MEQEQLMLKDSDSQIIDTFPPRIVQNQAPKAPEQGKERTLMDYAMPCSGFIHRPIRLPSIEADSFEIKQHVWDLLREHALFYGTEAEDPYRFLARFMDVCETLKLSGVSDDALRLRIFPFSLRGNAVDWLESQAHDSLHTWKDVMSAFLSKYFPLWKTCEMRASIVNFLQHVGESLHETWDRWKALLRKCPHHGNELWYQVQIFYSGLRDEARKILDSSCGCSFMSFTPQAAYDFIERCAEDERQWYSKKCAQQKQLEAHQQMLMMAKMEKAINDLEMVQRPQPEVYPSFSDQDHQYPQLPQAPQRLSLPYHISAQYPQVNQAPLPFSLPEAAPPGFHSQALPQPQVQVPPVQQDFEKQMHWNNSMEQRATSVANTRQNLDQYRTSTDAQLTNLQASVWNLETQVGQLTENSNTAPSGGLPSNTVRNPRDVNAIFTMSGKQVGADFEKNRGLSEEETVVEEEKIGGELELEGNIDQGQVSKSKEVELEIDLAMPTLPNNSRATPLPSTPNGKGGINNSSSKSFDMSKLPFPPSGRKKPESLTKKDSKFLDILRKVEINVPLVDAIANVPSYAKFLKGALSNKTSMEKLVCLDENCSAVFQNKIPPKRQDPGSFTIPCTVAPIKFDNALCDLGASVNLMSLRTYKQLGLSNLTPTRMALQMADRTVRYPQGIAEDILVKVDRFAFPADFVVLEMDESARTPLLLGRPFLATAGAKIDIKTGEIMLGVDDETVTYNVYDDIKRPYAKTSDCFSLDLVDTCVLEETNMQVRTNKKGSENVFADHLSRLQQGELDDTFEREIGDHFLEDKLFAIDSAIPEGPLSFSLGNPKPPPRYSSISNYLTCDYIDSDLPGDARKNLLKDAIDCFWDDPYLFRFCSDNVIRRCVSEGDIPSILNLCHAREVDDPPSVLD